MRYLLILKKYIHLDNENSFFIKDYMITEVEGLNNDYNDLLEFFMEWDNLDFCNEIGEAEIENIFILSDLTLDR